MRVRVGIRVSEPLKRFKRIKQKEGSSFVVNFRYERLNIFCFLCGRLGHSEHFCDLRFNTDTKDKEREWGIWLKTADRRGVNLAGDKWLRTKDVSGNPSTEAAAARVPHTPSRSELKRKEQENRDLIIPNNNSLNEEDIIPPFPQRLQLQEICHANHARVSMQIDDNSLSGFDERKQRRGADSAFLITNPTSDVFPTGFPEDGSDEQLYLTAGPGVGVGRSQ
ncbi:uncharacterized protein LOC131020060 [Salvia miltiorrhiza]|uniref:uncharacterized protein LOC131020060 n=1 Tax=Salvia miltiorrhiza TaxID=226208 RepID=UPI0025AD52DC|nr:uncharacterized protein LOC131020060 [Salvia miltiorrhiza]